MADNKDELVQRAKLAEQVYLFLYLFKCYIVNPANFEYAKSAIPTIFVALCLLRDGVYNGH